MKTFKIIILLLTATVSVARAQFISADLQVSGLTCSMCSNATERSLKKLGFISDIKVDLNRSMFTLIFKKNAPVNLDEISQKVKNAGFAVNSLKATFDFNNTRVSNDYHFNYNGSVYHFMNVSERMLNGPVAVTILDKNFVPANTYKKYAAQTSMGCYKTGLMGSSKVYHLTI